MTELNRNQIKGAKLIANPGCYVITCILGMYPLLMEKIIDLEHFIHINAINYHEEWDQITFSSRYQNEIFVIDHSTTTEEASGHTGGNYEKGGNANKRKGGNEIRTRMNMDECQIGVL